MCSSGTFPGVRWLRESLGAFGLMCLVVFAPLWYWAVHEGGLTG